MSVSLFHTSSSIPESGPTIPLDPLCPGTLPLVLLPVRLETRFFTLATGATELRVRVFPDKIQIDSHEPDLRADEQVWGHHYWTQNWLAADDRVAMADAWRQVADRFGEWRAAWIVRVLTPSNTSDRPTGPPRSALSVPPAFPAVSIASSDEAWRRAPQARLMPDRWIAVVHAAGRVAISVTGKDIRRPLAVGPDPQAPDADPVTEQAIAAGERLAIDPGMKWMTDFDEAESVGMALRIAVPAAALAAGLDSLLVFGVTTSLSVAETSAQLADLLDAHHYTDGLAFVRPGTPTNNGEDRRSGYHAADVGHAASFHLEVESTPSFGDNNASRVGTALGLPTDRILPTFGRVDRGLEADDLLMRSMNSALWQVGWGYYLSNMIGGEAGLMMADIDWARLHFVNHVRSFGPFPAIRCGAQPYGLLPVTSIDLWQPGTNEPVSAQDTWLKGMLTSLRDAVWRQAVGSVARIGNRQNPIDPDADLAEVMRTDGLSGSYRTRNVFGRHFLQHLFRFLASNFADSDPVQTALLSRLGLAFRPRLAHLWHADWQWNVFAPLVQSGDVSPWATLEPNYIAALSAERIIENVVRARPDPQSGPDGTSLLQTLLRHAWLREVASAAARLQAAETGEDVVRLLRDVELVDLVTGAAPTPHWQRQLEKVLVTTGGTTIREFLEAQTTFASPALAALGEFRAGLATLKDLDSEALSHLMQGTLDLSTHRLDAWVTSVATKRLAAMRANGPGGLCVGAYGWVENLKPMQASSVKPVTALPAGEPGPLQTPANDSGFIHAPSMTHAATAALLRNAQLGPTGVPSVTGPFAIELSSRRVREASRLLEGVRQGQPLGALLGYRVERLLHETFVDNGRSMDRFIGPLRRVAPLVARAGAGATLPVETIAANNVVDGLVLHRRWVEERSVVRAELAKEGLGTSDLATLTSILDRLGDMIDGLSDALTAETAYQMARGNTSRTASTLAAIARGDAPPPDLEVTRTPRSGTSLTHRVLLLMSGPNQNTPGWISAAASARALAEPMLNYWTFKLLGDGRKIRCTVERLDDATGDVAETRAFPLSEVAIAPLDVVFGAEDASTTAQSGMTLSEIEQQVIYHVRRKADGFDAHAPLRLQHARPANLATGEITLFDAMEQARAVRRLLGVARGMEPEDLNPPERSVQSAIDLAELEARVVRSENALNAAHKTLATLITRATTTTTAELLRTWLLRLGAFGVTPAVPVSVTGDGPAEKSALADQGRALLKISGARLDQGAALRAAPLVTDQHGRTQQLTARMRAVFGPSFAILPRFTFDAAAATELQSALAGSTVAQGGDALAVHTWFARNARVRDTLGRFSSCLQRAEVLGAGARLSLNVAQLPFVGHERWVALPPAPGATLPPSKLSLVVHTIGPIDTRLVMTGLLVDEWVEIVPSAKETTALTFQFDAPDSVAPQCVLIATPPVPGQDWTPETLRRVLMETLDLAKLRAVDTASLGAAAQHLPGLYLALNTDDHAVSTDFATLTR